MHNTFDPEGVVRVCGGTRFYKRLTPLGSFVLFGLIIDSNKRREASSLKIVSGKKIELKVSHVGPDSEFSVNEVCGEESNSIID